MSNDNNTISGVYQIINMKNNKMYVGSSKNIENRWKKHIYDLNNKTHHNKHLQNAWNKYSEENFEFEVIEYVSNETRLIEREQYWMDELNSYNKDIGYNIEDKASIPASNKFSTKILSIQNRNMLLKNQYTKNECVFIFSLLPFVYAPRNEVKINYKYPTYSEIMKIVQMSRNTFLETIKGLKSKNIINIFTTNSGNIVTFNPNFFIVDNDIDIDTYEIFE